MKKVLIVVTTSLVSYGGLATVMLNYYRAMDKTGLQIDFASTNELDPRLHEELKQNNSLYFNLGNRKKNGIQYLKNLNSVLNNNNYDIVHVNGNSATMAMELLVAKRRKVSVRIAHGHAAQSNYPFLHQILKLMFKKSYTVSLAVSQKTADWLFDGYVDRILNNAIDITKYRFDYRKRKIFRDMLGAGDCVVLGTVGKMTHNKNQSFLLEIFGECRKRNRNSRLILVGDGDLYQSLKDKCRRMGLEEAVYFVGMKDNVADYLQAMDIFVFPSFYEGFGMALLEAQASGLCCLASDTIPYETKVSDGISYLSIQESAELWAEKILNTDRANRREKSSQACKKIRESGYCIQTEARKLEQLYREMSGGNCSEKGQGRQD